MTSPRNRAHDFYDGDVAPAIQECQKSPSDKRLAMIAAVALNQMADHYWHGFAPVDAAKVFNTTSPKAFRAELAHRHAQWSLIRDVAEAHKHVVLTRTIRVVTSAGQAFVAPTGFGTRSYGGGPYAGTSSVIIRLDDGREVHLSDAITESVKLWESMLK